MCEDCILLPVLVGLISSALGYLLGRLSVKNTDELDNLRADLETCRMEREKQLSLSSSLKSNIESWKNRYDSLQTDFDQYKLNLSSAMPVLVPFDAELAASLFLMKIQDPQA